MAELQNHSNLDIDFETPERSMRQFGDSLYAGLTRAALLICTLILVFLIGAIIVQGGKAMSLSFLLSPEQDFGAAGGILYQIIGSLLMVSLSALLVLPFAIGTATFRSEYLRSRRIRNVLDIALFSLNGVPSITYGLFGLIIFVNVFGLGISWAVGSVILAMMMLPTVTVSTIQAIDTIPSRYRENGYALGLNRPQVIRQIILPQSLHGVVTGLLIGLSRAIGETAPIMFIATAFSGVSVPSGLLEPVATLPTHILALAQQATNPDALRNAWGASLTLILLVMTFSALSFYTRLRLKTVSER